MSVENAAQAVRAITEVVLADPRLRVIAAEATTLQDLRVLWVHDAFRRCTTEVVRGVTRDDMRAFVRELSEDGLRHVPGAIGLLMPAVRRASLPELYLTAVGRAVQDRLAESAVGTSPPGVEGASRRRAGRARRSTP